MCSVTCGPKRYEPDRASRSGRRRDPRATGIPSKQAAICPRQGPVIDGDGLLTVPAQAEPQRGSITCASTVSRLVWTVVG
jgi:hypothetical protein